MCGMKLFIQSHTLLGMYLLIQVEIREIMLAPPPPPLKHAVLSWSRDMLAWIHNIYHKMDSFVL